MIVLKRTFEAEKYPFGSEKRNVLNLDSLTSEYMPSYKYVLRNDDGTKTPYSYRTKQEAIAKAEGKS